MRYETRFESGEIVDAPKRSTWLRDHAALVRGLAVGVVIAAVASLLGEYLLVAPVAEARDTERLQAEALAAKNRADEATLVGYDEFLRKKADTERRFAEATASVPTQAEMASVLESIRALAADSGMRLVSFTPAANAGPASGDTLFRFSASVVVRGGYSELERLLGALGSYPRMLTVDNLAIGNSPDASATIDATITLTCYYKAAKPAGA